MTNSELNKYNPQQKKKDESSNTTGHTRFRHNQR